MRLWVDPQRRLREGQQANAQYAEVGAAVRHLWLPHLEDGPGAGLQARLRQGEQAGNPWYGGPHSRGLHRGTKLQAGQQLPLALQALRPEGWLQVQAPRLLRAEEWRLGQP